MNKTAAALLVKFAITFIAALIALSLIIPNWWWAVLVIAIIGTAANYFLGDLIILPTYGNVLASIGDGILAALIAWVVALVWPVVEITIIAAIVYAVIIAVAEYFFHMYLESSEEVQP
ncbi:hypothetical protein SYNTR_0690 [Candidatus Syntrophocurvum alkaliphilum]|uniref:DUF2512 family protein n=1 Tax=Candidatus Syntrophocurvum alkaliphilum TaxID=2293317 RepID=A0A6I6DFX4_9FIRM|nr:DUF2512 family protein [Candidatus Syntrophocurvum alkaliphilum]QGT99283.1 hypothetical protein SYNTR_0690 [Candidatus Syntrophocurvum alkaliphilum]